MTLTPWTEWMDGPPVTQLTPDLVRTLHLPPPRPGALPS